MPSDGLPPALALFGGAVLLPLLPVWARRGVCVAAPLFALAAMYALPAGESWRHEFLGVTVVWCRVDELSLLFGLVFCVIAALAGVYGWHRARWGEQASSLAYVGGGLLAVFAGDLLLMLIGWEIMAVASAFVIFSRRERAATRAGQRYLLVHQAAGGLLLLGILLILHEQGSAEFGVLKGEGIGAALVLAALCINAAVPPLHGWLPDAYPEATQSGSVFLSAFTTKTAVYCLIRGYPGSELLMWAGAIMAVYGVVFAVVENNMRRLLSYHIVSQVGYMVCGVGIGTSMGLGGSAAHAFCHILYKGLLFMGVGSVLHIAGTDRLNELGGLARRMPWTLTFYMIGAFSIAGVPLFNGFVSKSLVISAAGEAHHALIVLLLHLASVGTFLSVALKLPYFAWFGRVREGGPGEGRPRREAPLHMLLAMAITSALCIALGVAPGWLYERLPAPVDYEPYMAAHVLEALVLVTFTTVAFWQLAARLQPKPALTLDTDWFYRRGGMVFTAMAKALDWVAALLGRAVAGLSAVVAEQTRNPPAAVERLLNAAGVRVGKEWEPAVTAPEAELRWFDENRQRQPIANVLLWMLTVFAGLGVAALLAG